MYINIYISIIIFIIALKSGLNAGLLINEIACAVPGDDWVELFYYSEAKESLDISNLHVTMYYGTSESISGDPVTIYTYDRPETPWDDRFIVIHLTRPSIPDETDLTGDTNKNGYIDVYCDNYVNSLWSTDCIVAIDNDNSISNDGIIDFVAYSNRDGTISSAIESKTVTAQGFNQWNTCSAANIEECMFYIGKDDLSLYMTIARKNTNDTNSINDFEITKYMTPGRENILSGNINSKSDIFKAKKKKVSLTAEKIINNNGTIDLFVFENCNIRLRIFSSIGMLIYESPLYKDIHPGDFKMPCDLNGFSGRKAATGLYIANIEATRTELKKSQEEKIYLIICRNKK